MRFDPGIKEGSFTCFVALLLNLGFCENEKVPEIRLSGTS